MKSHTFHLPFEFFRLFTACLLILAGNLLAFTENPSQETVPIYLNQLGYLPASPKIVLVSSSTGVPFDLIEHGTQKSVFRGMLEQMEPRDTISGSDLWMADFSVIQATGMYRLQIPGVGSSDEFPIDENIYQPLLRKALSAFTYHRCGIALPKPLIDQWARGACHGSDGIVYSATPGDPIIHNATGGWFDGSDYGKYVTNGVFASGILLMLYERFPNEFSDHTFPIPEPANQIPDLLDEVRWELEFLLRMQNEEGGIYHKLTPMESGKIVSPDKDDSPRYLFPPSTTATAGTCALLAKASRLYSPYDATFAARCLESSRAAWKYLEAHPNDGGFTNPPSVRTKEFHDTEDSDERFWAAIELFIATRDSGFQEAAIDIGKKRIPLLSAPGYWGNAMPLAIGSMLQMPSDRIDPDLRKTGMEDLTSLANSLLETVKMNGFRFSLKEDEFTWGSNGALLENALILCLADINTPHRSYRQAAQDQIHAILGRNPLSLCYVTGFGSRSPMHPYHLLMMSDKIEEPIPGLLVAGPNFTQGDSALKRVFPLNAAPATVYMDSEESMSSNETDLTWNAVLAYVVTYLSL